MRKNAREDQGQKYNRNKYQSIDDRSRGGLRPSRTTTEHVESANNHEQKTNDTEESFLIADKSAILENSLNKTRPNDE
jgi:hypothetical protein